MGLTKSELRDVVLSLYDTLQPKPTKRQLSRAFGLSRSMLYYHPTQPNQDLQLKNAILKWYEKDDTLGSRKLSVLLGKSKGCMARVMIKYGIYPRRKRPAYRYAGKANDIVDNRLLKQLYANHAVLFSDIFQFRLADRSWVYCCFIIRRKTRQILAFCYSWGMCAELVVDSLERVDLVADLSDIDVIFHSDQGSQYGAKITIDTCLELHFERSMSRAGTPTDNPIAERFVQTFKLAVVERYHYQTLGEFAKQAEDWLNFYNQQRPHASLEQLSPNQFAIKNGWQTVDYLTVNFV